MNKRIAIPILAALTVLTACGGNNYGNSQNFSKVKGNGAASIFDQPSPSAAAALGEGAAPPGGSSQSSNTSNTQTQHQQQQATHFQIKIVSDTSGQSGGFSPVQSEVYKGTIIEFTNTDTKPRSVVSDSSDPAQFNSGPIAPGATWSYTAGVAGAFAFSDGTRPYARGTFTVVNH